MDGGPGGDPLAAFPDCICERDEIVFVWMGWQGSGMSNQFPTTRGGDSAGMLHAQVPRMRLAHGGERPDYSRRIPINEGQCRDGIVWAPGPAAATGNIHAREAIALACSRPIGHAQPTLPLPNRYLGYQTVTISPWLNPATPVARDRADGWHRDTGGRCVDRCCREMFRGGAAAPNGSTWRCWRPMSRSNADSPSG